MAKQHITNPDGSLQPGFDAGKLAAAGILLVRPTAPPATADGQTAVDTQTPDLIGGIYYQKWQVVAAPTASQVAAAIKTALAGTLADNTDLDRLVVRAVIGLLIDELNFLRKWTRDLKTGTAGASSLATFQAAVAALPTLADRTVPQAKAAVQARITSGGD